GGYDPIFIYLHETDFCFRTQLAGHALTFVPDAVLAVRFRRDRKSTFKQSYRWGEYNILLFKRYKSYGALPKHRWKRLFLELRYVISQLFRWYKLDDGQKMRTLWLLGWLLGKFKGMIRYRTGPY
ncbi:MAG: hypothetical protein KDJ38_18010, partial [Gammaproteobacteria bacterium]|nr:hypothetical protein [Gammaproteobacteria bacterium]